MMSWKISSHSIHLFHTWNQLRRKLFSFFPKITAAYKIHFPRPAINRAAQYQYVSRMGPISFLFCIYDFIFLCSLPFHCQSIHKTVSESVRGEPQVSYQGDGFPGGYGVAEMSISKERPLNFHIVGTKQSCSVCGR